MSTATAFLGFGVESDALLDDFEEDFKSGIDECCERASINCQNPQEWCVIWNKCCGTKTRFHYCEACVKGFRRPWDDALVASCGACAVLLEAVFFRRIPKT